MKALLSSTRAAVDRFLFEACDPRTCNLIRICYALLLIVYVGVWMLDGSHWFSDAGVLSRTGARAVLESTQWSLFLVWPATPELIQVCLGVLLVNAILLLVGVAPRVQAAMVFFWLVSFQHRNPLICDGEDTVFRLFAFFLIWIPAKPSSRNVAWGLRLFQAEMTLIYVSAAWSKCLGEPWRDGSALYYVYQMHDLFGRGPLPKVLMESETLIRYSTWGVVLIEAVLPLALWWPRTRRLAIAMGLGLHLSMEYAMHLFLFQWIMMLGLLSFLGPKDWDLWNAWLCRWRPTKKTATA